MAGGGRGAHIVAILAGNALLFLLMTLQGSFALALLGFALLAPASLIVIRRPQAGILLLVAAAPFGGLLTIAPHPTIVNAWKEALVLISFSATFVCPDDARGRPSGGRPPWVPAFGALVATALIAASTNPGLHSILGLKITFFYVLAAWCVWRCPLGELERDRLISILMATGAIEAVFGLLQQVAGPTRMHQLGFPYNDTIRFAGGFFRSFGTFVQPFGLGFYLMAVILVCTPVALSDRARLRNILFLAFVPVLGLSVAATVVRGAALGIGIGIAYLGLHRHRILLLAFPLGLVAVLLLPPEVSHAALSSSSTAQRATGWRQNLAVITTHPLGEGPGTTAAGAESLTRYKRTAPKHTYQPDNYYFHIAYEDGLLGLWGFVLLIAGAFLTARHASRHSDVVSRPLAEGITAFFVAAAGASVVATLFEVFPIDVLFWVLLSVVSAMAAQPTTAGPGVMPAVAVSHYGTA